VKRERVESGKKKRKRKRGKRRTERRRLHSEWEVLMWHGADHVTCWCCSVWQEKPEGAKKKKRSKMNLGLVEVQVCTGRVCAGSLSRQWGRETQRSWARKKKRSEKEKHADGERELLICESLALW
jgi:hypothetical protein